MSSIFAPAPEPKTELGRYRILSSTAGVRVSPLQLGAMSIGDAWSEAMAGGNFIDTANGYQDEQSETWLGEWMKARNNRDQMIIATKYSNLYLKYALGAGRSVNYSGNHKHSMFVSLRDSLKKLQTDWVDILYVHFWDHTCSIEEIMDSLHILVEQGKVLYLGISDCPAWIVSAANYYARAHGKNPFSIYQGRWNVMLRDFERDILPTARHFGMALAPWDAMGGGRFQTRKTMDERKKQGEGLRTLIAGAEQTPDEVRFSEGLAKVAAEHGTEFITAIALAYVMCKAPNVFPIVGGRKVEHLHSNIEALKIKLTDKQIEYLESLKPFDLGFPNSFIGEDPKVTGKSTVLLSGTAPMAFVQSPKPIGREV
ncbi:putative aryl-alcohol dehydrogenase Aad14 [Lojkania enalia]|uniref:Aryl-alcohol dehydrogenase Aad14 n=1 Tax=Lojkania enalia TaxID=147567 RepID=A0A9P4NAS7_9PLEO|nr:putative aryl-alcohol dehydrogenase Aad14 [Didymosphaeria enalia]